MKHNNLESVSKEQSSYESFKSKNKLEKLLTVFIIALIIIEVIAIALTFIFYNEEDEGLYYNKTRLISAEKLNQVKEAFRTGDYSFSSWEYPYAVLDNKGNVVYSSYELNLDKNQDLQSFLQFDRSSAVKYKGYIKSSFPVIIDGENKGFFVNFIKKEDLEEKTSYQRKMHNVVPTFIALIIITFLLFLFKLYISRKVLKPIEKITQSSNDIIKGKLDNYVTFNSNNEIGELSYAFELMRDELSNHREREERLKSSQKEIIAAISHDLKTPLSSIRIYVEAIRDGLAEKEEERQEYTSIILKKVDTLNSLIDDLLEHSKAELEVLSINKKEVHIKPFLEKLIHEIDLELSSTNIKFYWNNELPEGIINIDEMRIIQVVFNIISNSIKYSKDNLIINFKAEIEDRYLFIYIADNGIGIVPEDIPYIFNKFYRGDKSRNSKIPGSGLGLSTCKYIIEKHQGDIYCKSLGAKGSIFYFSIPLA